jgi:hypothetical protein
MTVRFWRRRSLARAQRQTQRGEIGAAQIGECDALAVVPDALIGVEFRRIAGQLLEAQAVGGPLAQEVLDGLTTMDGRPVPDHQEFAADLAQQQAPGPDR